jgi:hypothetical protein
MAGWVLPLVTDTGSEPPFVVNDHGDLHVVESLDDPGVESFDALDFEYFDAEGKKLSPTVVGYRVSLHLDTEADPEPERLADLIQAFVANVFARGDFREEDRVLLEQVEQASTLRDAVLALGTFIDARESRRAFGRLMRRKRP